MLHAAQKSLVIFDCDGVLVDSEPLAAQVFAEALQDLGADALPEQMDERFRGRSLTDCIDEVRREWGVSLPDDFQEHLVERTRRAFEGRLEPIPDVTLPLAFLSRQGIAICVASSGGPEKIRHSLSLTQLTPYFIDASGQARLFSASQVARGKPHPDLFLFAAAQMGRSARDCIVIEDSRAGVLAAVAAKMPVLGFAAEGAESAHGRALGACGARTFDRMRQLPALLEEALGLSPGAC